MALRCRPLAARYISKRALCTLIRGRASRIYVCFMATRQRRGGAWPQTENQENPNAAVTLT